MPSTRRQKAKARISREMDILYDIENMDVMLGNGKSNPIERELTDAIEQSSVQGDVESNTHLGDQYASLTYENNSPGKMMIDNSLRPFQMSLTSDYLKRWTQEMEKVIPEIQNIVSSMSSSGNRDTEASVSPNSQENRKCSSGFKSKLTKKDSRSACDLRDTTSRGHYI